MVDSVGAGVPEKMFQRKQAIKEQWPLARQWSQFLPLFKRVIADSNTGVIGISQLREAIGGMGGFGGDDS